MLLLILVPGVMIATALDSGSTLASSWSLSVLLAGAVVVLALAGCLVSRRSRRHVDGDVEGRGSSPESAESWIDPELLSLRLDATAIEDIKTLGYPDLWLVRFKGDRLLVSTRLPPRHVTAERVRGFADDIKIMARLQHPNIVALVGVAWTNESDLRSLSEFIDGGNLHEFLRASPRQEWGVVKLRIAIGVVEALAYAHSFLPPVVYGELKPRNVLLTSDLTPKLTDFAAAIRHSRVISVMAGMPTRRWMAPEVLQFLNESDQRSDVYGFGWILAQLDSHRVPFQAPINARGDFLEEAQIWRLIIAGDLRLAITPTCPRVVRGLIERCLSLNPSERPSADECVGQLREILAGMTG